MKLLKKQKHCPYCDISFDGMALEFIHIDHIQPKSKGGSHDEENLVLACSICNIWKADRSIEEWFFYLEKKRVSFSKCRKFEKMNHCTKIMNNLAKNNDFGLF